MKVHYDIGGAAHSLDLQAGDDLREIYTEIEQRLRAEHPEAASNPALPLLVSDGVLNSLANDSDEIALGKLD